MRVVRGVLILLLAAAAVAVVLAGIGMDGDAPDALRTHYIEKGGEETGAVNRVSAIYLGYRAFDTMGETIVLLLAGSGVVFLLAGEDRG